MLGRNYGIRKTRKRASSFNTEANANLTQARFIKENKKEIQKWLQSDTKSAFGGTITMDREIGIVVKPSGNVKKVRKAFIYLGKKESELGYRIVTSLLLHIPYPNYARTF